MTAAVCWFWSSFVRIYQNITPIKIWASKLIYSSLWSVFKLKHRWESYIEALKWLENRATTVAKWVWALIFDGNTRLWWIQLLEQTAYKKRFLLRLSGQKSKISGIPSQKCSKIFEYWDTSSAKWVCNQFFKKAYVSLSVLSMWRTRIAEKNIFERSRGHKVKIRLFAQMHYGDHPVSVSTSSLGC